MCIDCGIEETRNPYNCPIRLENPQKMEPQVEYIANIAEQIGYLRRENQHFQQENAIKRAEKKSLEERITTLDNRLRYRDSDLQDAALITDELRRENEVLTKKLAKLQPKKTVKKEKKGKK